MGVGKGTEPKESRCLPAGGRAMIWKIGKCGEDKLLPPHLDHVLPEGPSILAPAHAAAGAQHMLVNRRWQQGAGIFCSAEFPECPKKGSEVSSLRPYSEHRGLIVKACVRNEIRKQN